jgi:hypothetical protein
MSLCKCEDSRGVMCLKPMTKQEKKQDGMCQNCADHVWNEMTTKGDYYWENQNKLIGGNSEWSVQNPQGKILYSYYAQT